MFFLVKICEGFYSVDEARFTRSWTLNLFDLTVFFSVVVSILGILRVFLEAFLPVFILY